MENLTTAALWAFQAWNRGSAEDQDEAMKNLKARLRAVGVSEEQLNAAPED